MTRFATSLGLLCIAGAAFASGGEATSSRSFKVSLAPGKIHEECTRVDAGDKRRWHWKADAPVDFNIHYHQGKDVFYPVKRDAMRGDGGTFTAKSAEDYCWMWTAKDAAVQVEGGIVK